MRHLDSLRSAFLSLAAFISLGFSGCATNTTADAGAVDFLIEASPANLDPRIGTDAYSERIHGLLYSSLLSHDAQMNPAPDLAERWEMWDSKTYVFHLRRGVRFHTGEVLSSADVKYTFDSILSGAVKTPKRGAFRTVESVSAPDESTVLFHLREPDASFLWNLTRPGIGIVPKSAGFEIAQHPNGTGPFRFVEMTADEEVTLEANPDYFGGRPRINRLRLRIVPDGTVRALELRKGSADLAFNSLTPDMTVALERYSGIAITQEPGTTLAYVAFNFDDSVLRHKEVRQALAYATDRATLIRYLLRGQARPAASLLPPNHWAYEPNVRQYDYDPSRAEKLLDGAGFPRRVDGIRLHLTLKTSTEESTRLLSAALQDQWRRVGVALELRPLEFATFYSDITRGSFQLYTQRWVGGNNDPQIFEYVFSSRKFPPNGANRGHYRNPDLDSLLDRAGAEPHREKRREIFSAVQKIVAEDAPYINLWYMDNICVHRQRVANVELSPTGDYDFLERITVE
ncbi:MAG: ABC transporter substrate-binding protein [Candidatus Acidiferrales bacterium]